MTPESLMNDPVVNRRARGGSFSRFPASAGGVCLLGDTTIGSFLCLFGLTGETSTYWGIIADGPVSDNRAGPFSRLAGRAGVDGGVERVYNATDR